MQNLILNRYRPISTAGKGGFATVQVAWDTRIQRRVAIKCLPLEFKESTGNPYDVAGLDEARTAALLSDPTIVGVYDFEVEENMAYLIMEYVDGMTLTQLMHDINGPLPMDIISVIFDSISHALKIAHSNQVLHLDIKPDNILINRQGQVKVTDFGLAQLSHNAGYGQAVGGTIGYMPLEQMRMEPPDERTDEWALAAILYEMLTGENPFFATTLEGAEQAIESAELIVPSVVRGDVHPVMDDVIFDALAIDREDRFDSIDSFAEAIDPYLGDSRQGSYQLAAWIGDACEDLGEGDEAEFEGVVHLDRLSEGAKELITRFSSAAFVSILGVVLLLNIPDLFTVAGNPTLALWGLIAVLIMGSVLSPAIACAIVLLAFVGVLCLKQAYVLATILLFMGALWWCLSARKSPVHTACGISSVVFGAVGFGAVSPLLSGYLLRPRDALLSALFSFVVVFILASSGSMSLFDWSFVANLDLSNHLQSNAWALASSPATWLTAVAWIVSAGVVSLACQKGWRALAFFGVLGAAVLLCGSVLVSSYLGSGMTSWMPDIWTMATVGTSCGIMAFCTLLGVPWKTRMVDANSDGFEQ